MRVEGSTVPCGSGNAEHVHDHPCRISVNIILLIDAFLSLNKQEANGK